MSGLLNRELEHQLYFEAADLSDGTSVCLNYEDLPRDIARQQGIECINERAFSIRHLMGGKNSYRKLSGK